MEHIVLNSPILEHLEKSEKELDPCILVIFGATGDLTARKLFPSLFTLHKEGLLPDQFACVGFARRNKDHEVFRQEMHDAVCEYGDLTSEDEEEWAKFVKTVYYHRSEFDRNEGYGDLNIFLKQLDLDLGTGGNRLFYLSTPPSHFMMIIENLHKHKLTYASHKDLEKWSRVIVEKPFGRDYHSAVNLQNHLCGLLNEDQIYRIDHWLGKETVQNLLVFRFANAIFESLWNNKFIDHVQITVGEDIGIGSRGRFFEETGLLRDIVQNHMMQLLCLVAMEPPVSLHADAVRNEKVKVLESVRPIPMEQFDRHVVRGQYASGAFKGKACKGYREEGDISADSKVETFMAIQLYIDNWRWGDVPFYLRAGKRMPRRTTEIAIVFKPAPGVLFQEKGRDKEANTLVIQIQPDEGITMKVNSKVPGHSMKIRPVGMDFRYGEHFGIKPPTAYERLICDCIAGDSTLFTRGDEVLNSWRLMTPILERWEESPVNDFPNYTAGTWGPEAASDMLRRQGREWL